MGRGEVEVETSGNRAGRRAVTLRDVAAAAKVHVATASRALDDGTAHPVSRETRARVKRVAEELGYRHHMMARGLRRGFSSTVGVVVADLGNPYTAPVMRGLQGELERADYMALMAESRDDSQALDRAVGHLLARQVDGLVLLAARWGDLDRILGWMSRVPVVLAVRGLSGSGVPEVTHDDLGGGALAAGHLAELGHRRVVQLPGPQDVQPFKDRHDSFAEATTGLGLEAWAAPAASRPVFDEGRRLMALALAEGRRATGVFAHNDAMAMGAVRALREAGLDCPRDVSVVGYNDVPMADCFDPPLTTIRLDGAEVGRQSAESVLAAIRGLPIPTRATPVPAELVVRASARRPVARRARRRAAP
ncbi:MAG TPA: LacI family DNA-binding transcriptional regulator [Actinomycetes bacterium]|nr:LacI family DNA-binding transcriptional regulator [Actinomycetes bacterium]